MDSCVGCGYCCLKSMCTIGMREHGKWVDKCPFLIWEDDKYRCKLVQSDVSYENEIGTGLGCVSGLNDWRRNVKFRG